MRHGQVGDRRAESLGDSRDGARVGVEGFTVGQSLAHSVGQRVVGTDPSTDLAVLHVDADDSLLEPLELASS